MNRAFRAAGLVAAGTSLAAILATAIPGASAADLGAKQDTIRLAMNEWTGQHVTTHIAGQLLEKLGYHVEYVNAGNYPQFSGLADGSISATLEIWTNNVGEIYPKVLADKKIANIGELGLEGKDGWIYPSYMTSVCPGLPDYKALAQPACVKALASAETFPNGRLLDYPADWGSVSATVIKNADLPLVAVPGGSEGALVAELRAANAAQKPLLMRFWAPHWVLADVKVDWVTMPPCPSHDDAQCITPPQIIKVLWSEFEKKWPAAYVLLKNYQLHSAEQEEMMLKIDNKNQDLDAVTKAWVDSHESLWQGWIKAAQTS